MRFLRAVARHGGCFALQKLPRAREASACSSQRAPLPPAAGSVLSCDVSIRATRPLVECSTTPSPKASEDAFSCVEVRAVAG